MALVGGGIVDDYPIDGDGKRRGAFFKMAIHCKRN